MTDQRDVWEHLGRTDADWAVASAPGKRHGAWADEMDAFYASGQRRVADVLTLLPPDFGHHAVLDYGSGTGRLSFTLANLFDRVTSADISQSMISILKERAVERGLTNVETVDLNRDGLPADHDVAVSLITLQHFGTLDAVSEALARIASALRPGGYAVVDFPTPPRSLRRRVQPSYPAHRLIRKFGVPSNALSQVGLSGISMLYEGVTDFQTRLRAAGLRVLSHELYDSEYSVMSTYIATRE